jgi:hypothetical protein
MWTPNRPWHFRYRLTTLFGLTVLVAVVAAIYGSHLRALRRQEQAFKAIADKGGLVHVYSYGTQVYFETPPVTMCMNGIQRVIEPGGSANQFLDSDCELFGHVLHLHSVHFPGSHVSENAIASLKASHPQCRMSVKPFSEWQ